MPSNLSADGAPGVGVLEGLLLGPSHVSNEEK